MVTPPGSSPPTKPTSTAPAFDLTINLPGTWTVELSLEYDHKVDGSPWSSKDQGVIEAKSVIAALDPGPPQLTTTQTVVLDGSASQISPLAAASAVFSVDGSPIDGCSFPGPINDPSTLQCSFPASDLGPGTFIVSLDLSDSVGGTSDTDQATLEVIEEPPFSVDFLWTPGQPTPLSATFDVVLSDGWQFTDLETAIWDAADGSVPEELDCLNDFVDCAHWAHTFPNDGFYDVSVRVTAAGGQWDGGTHEVMIGNPPLPPTADFLAAPSPATVNIPVNFSFTGNCEDVCTYLWDFGDGSTSTSLNPIHTFVAPITRQVTLTVANDTGQDEAIQDIAVTNCWAPTGTIAQSGQCYGSPVMLTAQTAEGFSWSTGATTQAIPVAAPALYWVHLRQGLSCWAYVDHTVVLDQCNGIPAGNVTMDVKGLVDAADTQALIRELSDGDGQLVIDSWAGEMGAPGADLTGILGPNPDGLITSHDLNHLLDLLFANN